MQQENGWSMQIIKSVMAVPSAMRFSFAVVQRYYVNRYATA